MPEDEIKRCYIDQNMTMSETAKKLNINLSVLHKYIVSHGLVKDTEAIKNYVPCITADIKKGNTND